MNAIPTGARVTVAPRLPAAPCPSGALFAPARAHEEPEHVKIRVEALAASLLAMAVVIVMVADAHARTIGTPRRFTADGRRATSP